MCPSGAQQKLLARPPSLAPCRRPGPMSIAIYRATSAAVAMSAAVSAAAEGRCKKAAVEEQGRGVLSLRRVALPTLLALVHLHVAPVHLHAGQRHTAGVTRPASRSWRHTVSVT